MAKKKLVLFRCPECAEHLEEMKKEGEKYVTINGDEYDFDDIEIIKTNNSYKCGQCTPTNVFDVDLSAFGDKPWHLYGQEGETKRQKDGRRDFRMKIYGDYETFEEAFAVYEEKFKGLPTRSRINLANDETMIVVYVDDGKDVICQNFSINTLGKQLHEDINIFAQKCDEPEEE